MTIYLTLVAVLIAGGCFVLVALRRTEAALNARLIALKSEGF
jgi:hypothetical protein